jgi:hypothetical protein
VFNFLQTDVLIKAFDRAWDAAVREGILEIMSIEQAKEMTAKRIIDLANSGEVDEWRLARGAKVQLRSYMAEQRGATARLQGGSAGKPSRHSIALNSRKAFASRTPSPAGR